MLKRKIMVVSFLAFCLAATLFIGITTSGTSPSTKSVQPYDPWCDVNDDGIIDIVDIVNLAIRFGEEGTPINKTALLLELQSRVEALEAKFPVTTDNIADGAITMDKILDYAVTNMKLASGSIPYAYASSTSLTSTTSTSFVYLMSVSLTLEQTSFVIIMFSAETGVVPAEYEGIHIRALIDSSTAYPSDPGTVLTTSGTFHCNSFTFYRDFVSAGTYTVKITWKVTGGTGYIDERSLVVVALP